MNSSCTIRTIKASDTWTLRQQVMWPDKPVEYVMLENDEEGIHYGLFEDERLLSILSVFIKNNDAQFRKFATLTSEQGKGFGSQLLQHLFEQLHTQGICRVWCNARADKRTFYKRFGLKATSKTFSKGGIDYVVMEKIL